MSEKDPGPPPRRPGPPARPTPPAMRRPGVTPGPLRRPAPARAPGPATTTRGGTRAAPPPPPREPEPAPALVDDDDAPPLPEGIGATKLDAVLGEDEVSVVYGGTLGDVKVAVRLLRPERARDLREVDRFQCASQAAGPSGLEPLDVGRDPLGAPFLVVGRPAGDITPALLALAPLPPPPRDASDEGSSETSSLIFEKLQRQREQLMKDVAEASRRRERCLDHFVLLERTPGAGDLWRGYDSEENQVVAVRTFPAGSLEGEARTKLEAKLKDAVRPRHPGVIPLLHHGIDDRGRLYLVSELIKAGPLLEAPNLETALRLFNQAATALAYLHGLGIAHGGIHPGAVTLRLDGTVQLVDLGAAAAAEATGPTLAWRLARLGCAPPESNDGRADDLPGDVHALGALLLRVTAEWLPETPPGGVFPAPGSATPAPNQPLDLLAVVHRCLAPDPAERYPNAVELVRDLEKVMKGQLPSAREPKALVAQAGQTASSVVSTLSGVFKRLLGRKE